MKKVCFIIMFIAMTSISSQALAFTDTDEHWAKEAINKMSDKKILSRL